VIPHEETLDKLNNDQEKVFVQVDEARGEKQQIQNQTPARERQETFKDLKTP